MPVYKVKIDQRVKICETLDLTVTLPDGVDIEGFITTFDDLERDEVEFNECHRHAYEPDEPISLDSDSMEYKLIDEE